MTHDYKRNGTIDLFAAMNSATGEVLHDTKRRHAGADVLAFFKGIDLHVPRDLDAHVVLDNLSAHKSEPVRTWLADPKRARWYLHFTPTSASWLNLIKGSFSVVTREALTNTSFTSTRQLEEAIDVWASHWNHDPQPFVWTKSADDIITKVKRGRASLACVTESATHHWNERVGERLDSDVLWERLRLLRSSDCRTRAVSRRTCAATPTTHWNPNGGFNGYRRPRRRSRLYQPPEA